MIEVNRNRQEEDEKKEGKANGRKMKIGRRGRKQEDMQKIARKTNKKGRQMKAVHRKR